MLQTSSVREAIRKKGQERPGVVAVANSPREIMLRWNGRAYFGKEETMCYITTDNKVIFIFSIGLVEVCTVVGCGNNTVNCVLVCCKHTY